MFYSKLNVFYYNLRCVIPSCWKCSIPVWQRPAESGWSCSTVPDDWSSRHGLVLRVTRTTSWAGQTAGWPASQRRRTSVSGPPAPRPPGTPFLQVLLPLGTPAFWILLTIGYSCLPGNPAHRVLLPARYYCPPSTVLLTIGNSCPLGTPAHLRPCPPGILSRCYTCHRVPLLMGTGIHWTKESRSDLCAKEIQMMTLRKIDCFKKFCMPQVWS
jgi:hypothetical protein